MKIVIKEKYYIKRFKKKLALKDIELSFPEGETTLIIGTSGAGKSTLIKCIIGATNYDGNSSGYRQSDIAYIPQHPALNMSQTVYDTIRYNLMFAFLDGRSRDRHSVDWWTEKYLKDVALTAVSDQKNKDLSGGQRQRVSIAKELVRGKKIIIADEIDTGLDCGVAKALVESLSKITHENNLTTIIISHNLINIDLYDNVVVLVKSKKHKCGQIAFVGKTSAIKGYFGVSNYVDILTLLNSEEEQGKGQSDHFIEEHRKLQLIKKHQNLQQSQTHPRRRLKY